MEKDMSKKSRFLLAVIVLVSMFILLNSVWADSDASINVLRPRGQMSAPLSFAIKGVTNYVIVIPEKATTQDQKAANELRFWLGAITDANFVIVTDAQPSKDCEISIGKTNRLPQVCSDVNENRFGDEGYGISVKGGKIFLVGGKRRGPINAVISLLEEDIGCRWYTKDVNRIPHDPNLCLQIVQREYVPQFDIRDPFYYVAFDPNWSLYNRTNSSYISRIKIPLEWGGSTHIHAFGHSFDYWISPSLYKKDHPEYFGQNQPCLSNPDVLKIAKEKVLQIIKEKPEIKLISVSQNDGGGFCTCPKCAEVDRLEKSHAGSVLRFVNAIAETVEKTNPDVRIVTFAYMYTAPMPVITKPRKNVVIFLCTDTCTWEHPFIPVEFDRGPVPLSWPYWDVCGVAANELCFKNFFEQWVSTGNQIIIWDYSSNFGNFLAPMPNMRAVASNIRYFAQNNINGVFMQGNFQTNGGDRDFMRAWVIAKLLWNPYLNERELAKDFIYGYYGQAAPAILKYENLLWDIGLEIEKKPVSEMKPLNIRFKTNVEFLSGEFLKNANKIFDEAEKLAENEEILNRVRLMRASIRYVELSQIYEDVKRDKQLQELLGNFTSIAEKYNITYIGEGETFSKWAADCNAVIEK
jgi:hypothetical protein